MGVLEHALVWWCRRRPAAVYFDPAAESLTEVRRREADKYVDEFVKHVNVQGKRVVEVGCGDGGFSWALSERGASWVLGVDIAAESVLRGARVLKERAPAVRVAVHDAARLGLADNSVDVIFTMASFEHFPDPGAVIAECRRVLKPGGVLYACFEPWYGPYGGHLFDFIGIRWVHVLFPEQTTLRAWHRLSQSNPALAAHNYTVTRHNGKLGRALLNRITPSRFLRLVRENGLTVRRFDLECIKRLQRFRLVRSDWFPLRDFLTVSIRAVLEKPGR